VIIPYAQNHGRASLRKRIILTFRLNGSGLWKSEERLVENGNSAEEVRGAIKYCVWILREGRQAPGVRIGLTYGRPREEWDEVE
jgi:hypothetical protein